MIPIRIIHQIQTEIKDIVVILEVIIKDIIPVLDQEVIQNIDIPTTKKEDMMIIIIIDIIGIEDIIENIQIEKMVIEIEKKRKNT
jgi:hypothetical protein